MRKKTFLRAVLSIVLVMILCVLMVNEVSGSGQYLDEDKDKKIELGIGGLIRKGEEEFLIKGRYNFTPLTYNRLELGAALHGELAFSHARTGIGVNVRSDDLELGIAATAVTSLSEINRIAYNLNTNIEAYLKMDFYKSKDYFATLDVNAIINERGDMTAETMLSFYGPGLLQLGPGIGLGYDNVTHKTSLLFSLLSYKFSPLWGRNISGTIVYGDPSTPIFTCIISGYLVTTQEIPAYKVVTSLTSSINETDPSMIIFEGTSQVEVVLPIITSITPDHGIQGETLEVIITGTNFDGATEVIFGGIGITVNSFNVDSSTQITANITIDQLCYPGPQTISVLTPVNSATLEGGFTVEPKEGCFIATAAYGTPIAEEIDVLRDFRDGYLLTNLVGKGLVDFYYRVSPPMAKFITEHPSLKPIVRAGLLPAVAVSAVVINTTPAEKMAIVGLLALVSMALAVWTTRRRGKGQEYTCV